MPSLSGFRWLQLCIAWNFWYKPHISRQYNCWSFRCSWRTACRWCTILDLTTRLNRLCKDNDKTRRETIKCMNLMRLILQVWWHFYHELTTSVLNSTWHYSDVIMNTVASQITGIIVLYSIVYSGANQRKHQGSASLTFVREIHRWPVNTKGQ